MTKAARAKQQRKKREKMRKFIKAWQRSGMAFTVYCRLFGMNPKSVEYWKRRFRSESQAETKPTVKKKGKTKFVPVQPKVEPEVIKSPPPTTGSPLRLQVSNRFTIEVDDDFSSSTLQRLVSTLEQL